MKKIVFLTSTRADFGKIKSLLQVTTNNLGFEVYIFATGMHMNQKYGRTVDEIVKCGFKNIHTYSNHLESERMDTVLSKTIEGFGNYIREIQPDLIIIHGDRVEALAGAIVGALNNIRTAHIEGGEVSGTIDELVRHSVSKLCHVHFVSNITAKKRLIQMGELPNSIFQIGSPDIDIMLSHNLPTLKQVKKYYEIYFKDYAIAIFHSVVTELDQIELQSKIFVDSLIKSSQNYILIYPNNDSGSEYIFKAYHKIIANRNIRYLPSLRFEYFLVLLKNAKFIIGNSSAGVREAPYYRVPSINIGSRQNKRVENSDIINSNFSEDEILSSIKKALRKKIKHVKNHFGKGDSDKKFLKILNGKIIWQISKQKLFQDIL